MSPSSSTSVGVWAVLAASAALVAAAPGPLASLRTLADAGSAADVAGPLVALLTLLAWVCAAYLLTVAALTAGSRLPGLAGAALAAVARVAAPAGLRRALEVALGVTLAVGTLAGTAAAAGPVAADSGLSVQVEMQAGPAPVVAPPPSLDHPVTGATAAPPPSLDHPLTAATPAPDLDRPDTPVVTPVVTPVAGPAPAARQHVVVQPGDSLWGLAEERLEEQTGGDVTDAQVAQAWPSWWQANREVVGDDPDLLQPGQRLVPPGERPTDS